VRTTAESGNSAKRRRALSCVRAIYDADRATPAALKNLWPSRCERQSQQTFAELRDDGGKHACGLQRKAACLPIRNRTGVDTSRPLRYLDNIIKTQTPDGPTAVRPVGIVVIARGALKRMSCGVAGLES
jgi:hypothetical protein